MGAVRQQFEGAAARACAGRRTVVAFCSLSFERAAGHRQSLGGLAARHNPSNRCSGNLPSMQAVPSGRPQLHRLRPHRLQAVLIASALLQDLHRGSFTASRPSVFTAAGATSRTRKPMIAWTRLILAVAAAVWRRWRLATLNTGRRLHHPRKLSSVDSAVAATGAGRDRCRRRPGGHVRDYDFS